MHNFILTILFVTQLIVSNALANDSIKFVVVDIQKIERDSLAAKNIKEQIDKKTSEYKAEVVKMEATLNKENEELAKQQSVMSEEAFQQKFQALSNKVQEMNRSAYIKRASLEKASNDASMEVQSVIDVIMQELAKERKFDIAIPTSVTLVYRPDLDITDEVIKRLNQKKSKVQIHINEKAILEELRDQ